MTDLQYWLALLDDDSSKNRMIAAQHLGNTGDPDVIPLLIHAAQDNSVTVARTAMLALGKIGGDAVTSTLLEALEHDNVWVRRAAVQALGTARVQDVAPILVNALGDPELHMLAREALKSLHVDPDYF